VQDKVKGKCQITGCDGRARYSIIEPKKRTWIKVCIEHEKILGDVNEMAYDT